MPCSLMSLEESAFLASGRFPDADRLVVAASGKQFPIGRKVDTLGAARVTFHGKQALARGDFPDASFAGYRVLPGGVQVVSARRGKSLAVGRKHQCLDRSLRLYL